MTKNSSSNEKVMTTESSESEELDINIINNYNQLNDKCDVIISKIKNRKLKKNKNAA